MILVFALAQLLDVSSAMLMPVRYEANPLMRALLDQPLLALAIKVAAIVFVISAATIIARKKPRLGAALYPIGTIAGMVGAISNIAVLRALGEGA